jgi:hypothetical protein
MKYLFAAFGFLWLLPITIPAWLFYILPLLVFGQIRFQRFRWPGVAQFVLVAESGWYARKWQRWTGSSGPGFLIYRPIESERVLRRMFIHEIRHNMQQLVFGPLFYPAYAMASAAIWLLCEDYHAYLDNPFERDARRAAGQPVDIPRRHWPHGPNDRNPWW